MIKVNGITKSYEEIEALKNISFSIKKGEIFGLLGPNGAGKSTTINILSSLIAPDKGDILFDGISSIKNLKTSKSKIGIVPQEIALYEELSAFDNLLFWGSLYDIPKIELHQRVIDVLEMVGLTDRKNDKIKTYSGGMKRRINIASSILHNPKILLMDEPTVGVDPQSRNHVFEVIERLNKEGMTILYTTHYMEEAERLCDTIAIIDNGEIITQGTLKELRNSANVGDLLTILLVNGEGSSISEIQSAIPSYSYNIDSNSIQVECENIGKEISSIINKIQNAGGVIESIDTDRANLESIFLKLTGKTLRD